MEIPFELGSALVAGLIAGSLMGKTGVHAGSRRSAGEAGDLPHVVQNLLEIPGTGGCIAGFVFHEAIASFAAVHYALRRRRRGIV